MKRSRKSREREQQRLDRDREWSDKVLSRDLYTCRRCGHNSIHNHAHHIAPRSRRPDLKYELSNGMTVCPPCHNWIHAHPVEATALGFLNDEAYELKN